MLWPTQPLPRLVHMHLCTQWTCTDMRTRTHTLHTHIQDIPESSINVLHFTVLFFSMYTINHAEAPGILTCVIYSERCHRKQVAWLAFSPDNESSAVATVGKQQETWVGFSSVCVLTVIFSARNKRNGLSCGLMEPGQLESKSLRGFVMRLKKTVDTNTTWYKPKA